MEALEADVPLRRAFIVLRAQSQDPTLARLRASLEQKGVAVEEVSRAALDGISHGGAHQGVAIEVEPYRYADLHEIIELCNPSSALIVCLDHVMDEGNLGAIARSAECAGACGLVIANRRAASVGAGAYKASAGALAHLKVAQVPNIASAVDTLKKAGFWCVAATEHARKSAFEANFLGRLCIVVGAEDKGVSKVVRERCDDERLLPQLGHIESLNVAQAATVFAFEWLRQNLAHASLVRDGESSKDSSFEELGELDTGEFGDERADFDGSNIDLFEYDENNVDI